MTWTHATRRKYNRDYLRYPSDLTEDEYRIIAPFLPPAFTRGRPRDWTWRVLLEGVLYVLENGIAWRALPKDFPPWQRATRHKHSATLSSVPVERRNRKAPYTVSCPSVVTFCPKFTFLNNWTLMSQCIIIVICPVIG